MFNKACWLNFCLVLALLACSKMAGNYYLDNERYEQGIDAFTKVLHEDPSDPNANYYLGRFYLAQEKPEMALPFLHRAVELRPEIADYYFWLGVAYWAVMDFEKERYCYLRALALDKNHIPARLYLGHNLLDNGEWKAALEDYRKVLRRDPRNPEALYNQGLAFNGLGAATEETVAWRNYLKYYPEGKWALQAVEHLNVLGDFQYRNFVIGYRRVTLENIPFDPGLSKLPSKGKPSLQVLGSILSTNKNIRLEIVGYMKNDSVLATARAKAVREYLLESFPAIHPSRLKYHGERCPERIEVGNRTYYLSESVSFVTTKR